jgi:hypothetical protein
VSGQTVLDLLEAGDLPGALSMMEQLRIDVELVEGEKIPFDKLPLMPLNEHVSRFEQALGRLENTDPALRKRLEDLKPWLVGLKVLQPEVKAS